jgi:hypothetical protein
MPQITKEEIFKDIDIRLVIIDAMIKRLKEWKLKIKKQSQK